MAGELIAQLDPSAFYRETSSGYNVEQFTAIVPGANAVASLGLNAGTMRGVTLNKQLVTTVNNEYYQCVFTIPANLTVSTGLTLQLRLVDDGTNGAAPGTGVVIGVTAFNVDSASFNVALTGASGAEQTGTATLNATSGIPASLNIAIPNAQLASAGAGNNVLLRIRRIGTNASDTCPSRAVLLSGHVKNT